MNVGYVDTLNGYDLGGHSLIFGLYHESTLNKPPNDKWGAFFQVSFCQLAFGGITNKVYTRRYSNQWSNWEVM